MTFGPLEIIFLVYLLSVVVIFVLALIVHYLYPNIKPSSLQAGNGGNGAPGAPGPDGILSNTLAVDGEVGYDGREGKLGKHGNHAPSGVVGDNGAIGPEGLIGAIGAAGEPGVPSNSYPSVIARTDGEVSDSYIMEDFFTYNDVFHELIIYTNIENHSRFVLHHGREIPDASLDATVPVPGNPVSDVRVGEYFSNLRIALCLSDGSTDTVIYVSPPIARRSFLFKYIHDAPVDDTYSQIETKFPIRDLNESDSFYFFKDEPYLVKQNESKKYYHVVKGLAKYKIVANLTPKVDAGTSVRYRIIETFDQNQDITFVLPKINFPTGSDIINIVSPDTYPSRYIMNISGDFDLNRVVERSFVYGDKIWNETSETVLNILSSNISEIIPFENTYNIVDTENKASLTFFETPPVNWSTKTFIDNTIIATNNYIKLKSDVKYNNVLTTGVDVNLGLREYLSNLNVSNFYPRNKFFLQFDLFLRNPYSPTIDQKVTITYGSKYSIDSINFSNLYGKALFFPQVWNMAYTDDVVSTLEMSNDPGASTPTEAHPESFPLYPIRVGYSTPDDSYLYTVEVYLQRSIAEVYYINIPLHGYKKG